MFEIQQYLDSENQNDWFTVDSFDSLEEADKQLQVLRSDEYYKRFVFRIHNTTSF